MATKKTSSETKQLNFLLKMPDHEILRSLANHYDCSMTKVIVQLLRKTGKPRGRPRINQVRVGRIA